MSVFPCYFLGNIGMDSDYVYELAFWHRLWSNWMDVRRKLGIKSTTDFVRRLKGGLINLEVIRSYSGLNEDDIVLVRRLLEEGVRLIPIISDAYPASLRRLNDGDIYPPLVLYCIGELRVRRCVAVVGTRFCTNWGKEVARKFVKAISREINDVVIVTGLAKGIDTEATKAALDFGLKSVAVLPWLKPVYPPENKGLSEEIIKKGGVLVSENLFKPASSSEIKRRLYLRNRIISALADAVVVIEARLHYIGNGKYSGGAMWQVEYALKRGKPVFVLEPKYKGFRMGKVWVNYRKAFEEFVRHGAVPFKEEKIDYIVKKIANVLTGCSLSEQK